MRHDELKGLVEALIFVSDEPLSSKHIGSLLDDVEESEIQAVLDALHEYRQSTGP